MADSFILYLSVMLVNLSRGCKYSWSFFLSLNYILGLRGPWHLKLLPLCSSGMTLLLTRDYFLSESSLISFLYLSLKYLSISKLGLCLKLLKLTNLVLSSTSLNCLLGLHLMKWSSSKTKGVELWLCWIGIKILPAKTPQLFICSSCWPFPWNLDSSRSTPMPQQILGIPFLAESALLLRPNRIVVLMNIVHGFILFTALQ